MGSNLVYTYSGPIYSPIWRNNTNNTAQGLCDLRLANWWRPYFESKNERNRSSYTSSDHVYWMCTLAWGNENAHQNKISLARLITIIGAQITRNMNKSPWMTSSKSCFILGNRKLNRIQNAMQGLLASIYHQPKYIFYALIHWEKKIEIAK